MVKHVQISMFISLRPMILKSSVTLKTGKHTWVLEGALDSQGLVIIFTLQGRPNVDTISLLIETESLKFFFPFTTPFLFLIRKQAGF